MKYIRIYTILLLFVFINSCKGQGKTDSPKENISQERGDLSDIDTYFVESKAITTSQGPSSITRNIIQDRKGNIWIAT